MMVTLSTHCSLLHNETDNVRHKSFSSFVKNLLSIVSPSTTAIKSDESEKQVRCLFEDMYFSFPAFEEDEEQGEGRPNCRHPPSLIVGTNRIMC
ncbi:hypothetical protein G6F57_015011 [Rhizopus arrhizus]|jgi:hypothetical protein|uniref:Uncharacterized protein n=1 Tax=Rhizopus oryzae TaxID=64495 RepID=A0A9P6WX84_RHIOR|nr:hypothetical protein G6F23_012012 [Rhizopus arrhizus]KAG1394018.1 hypothetical protein G6F58_012199 [Rhizopus delemar]KAG0753037.1 hypothetical protein G6F24_013227 [Rhizopus arrhizus]KAG0771160.1 hypothetical protein G6F22_016730 [Rhizopus arrhizus]KAG0778979.1 hypothetical protein G6F21_012772 [Rhizopus arrhizus]